MDSEAGRSRVGVSLLVGLAAIVGPFAGSASVSDRTAATRAAPVDAKAPANVATNALPARAIATHATAEDAPGALLGGGIVRRKVRCVDCGVIESVSRIDRRESLGGVCSFAHSDRLWITGSAHDSDEYGGAVTLAGTVEGVLAGRPAAKRAKITTSYRFVVRLRDGSRHVFDEATPRAMHSGERVQVIAGMNLPT